MVVSRKYRSNDRNIRSKSTNEDLVDVVEGGRNLWADNAGLVRGELDGEGSNVNILSIGLSTTIDRGYSIDEREEIEGYVS